MYLSHNQTDTFPVPKSTPEYSLARQSSSLYPKYDAKLWKKHFATALKIELDQRNWDNKAVPKKTFIQKIAMKNIVLYSKPKIATIIFLLSKTATLS